MTSGDAVLAQIEKMLADAMQAGDEYSLTANIKVIDGWVAQGLISRSEADKLIALLQAIVSWKESEKPEDDTGEVKDRAMRLAELAVKIQAGLLEQDAMWRALAKELASSVNLPEPVPEHSPKTFGMR